MSAVTPGPDDAALDTRRSLINRLRNVEDQDSWQEFFDRYWKLIYSVSRKAGLSEDEAEEVVQETVITVSKYIGEFRYEPGVCSFKTWLLHKTRWRIIDQVRKRPPDFRRHPHSPEGMATTLLERIPNPDDSELDALWESEWRRNLFGAAMERVKRRVRPEHYQIFHLSAVQNLGPKRVAEALGVNIARVYLVRHRVAGMVRREIEALEQSQS